MSAEAERAESFVGPTELGEYDSDREDGEIMQEYMTRRVRQWNGVIAVGLGVGVPKERFAEVLLEGSRLSDDGKRRMFAGVTLLLQGAASETQPWTCAGDAMQSHEEVVQMIQRVRVRSHGQARGQKGRWVGDERCPHNMYQTSQRRSQEMGAMKAPERSVLTQGTIHA